jgi:hypothetical protein
MERGNKGVQGQTCNNVFQDHRCNNVMKDAADTHERFRRVFFGYAKA